MHADELSERTTPGYNRLHIEVHRLKGQTAGDWDATLSGPPHEPPTVKSLEFDGLAYRCGVREGDAIVSVDGVRIAGHAEGVQALDRAEGSCILVIERPATDPIEGVLCCFCALLIAALIVACGLSFVLKLIMQGNIDDLQQPSPRLSMPRPRYGGPEPWRARCLPARTLFTVSSWPPVARNSSRRWEVLVRGDADAVGLVASDAWHWSAGSTKLCIFSARTGLPVDNIFLADGLHPKPAGGSRKRAAMVAAAAPATAAASVAPDAGTDPVNDNAVAAASASGSSSRAHSTSLIFEPAAGPGTYEIYDSCIDPFSAPVDAAWRSVALAAARAALRGGGSDVVTGIDSGGRAGGDDECGRC